jgi:hypothetical protein
LFSNLLWNKSTIFFFFSSVTRNDSKS